MSASRAVDARCGVSAAPWLGLSWSALEAWIAGRTHPAVLLPVGAVEQHGPFLPLGTDLIIAERIAASIAAALDVMVAPAVAIAASDAHLGFPGTLSLGTGLLREALVRICEQLLGRDGVGAAHGKAKFARVFVLSAHAGNARALRNIATLELVSVLPGWWELPETRNVISGGGIIEGAHADDTETSLLLHYGYDIPLPALPFLLPKDADDADPERQDTRAVSKSGILASGLYAPSAECGRALHLASVSGYRRLLEADGVLVGTAERQ